MAISGLFLAAQELAQTKGLGKYLESKHPERQIPQDFSVTTSVTVLAPCSEPAPAPVAFLCSQTCSGVHVGVSSLFLLLRGETGLGTEKGEGALLGSDGQRVPHAVSLPASPKASSVTGHLREPSPGLVWSCTSWLSRWEGQCVSGRNQCPFSLVTPRVPRSALGWDTSLCSQNSFLSILPVPTRCL